ncbi:efflux RND transporter periplasmic adaptor subunit [Aureibacter tunicatorum]|uniref:Membrane fusion protein (Multidrug efflux system) n=1 Tax=Aureibacter tunicatorum TaxID=866807 RepID=A0AAE3XPE0_9BACT|nr:efflux RND transporter periplasmic adaptor subunit [Aureibacter tunicatorum]MDR6240200.1 membrane fusion protein (multidrug efflux system) [Aureibacter tunicatorum]BDD05919.1 acriflavin resistance protein [Aureibacter tunicatorum]
MKIKQIKPGYISSLLIFTLALLFMQCNKGKKMPPPPIVATSKVALEDIKFYGDYVGRTQASLSVQIRARVNGFLEKRLFEEGTKVHKGQLLYVIDKRPYQAAVIKSEAQLSEAKVELDIAQRHLNRIKPLFEQNAASRLDLDNAIARKETAEAKVEIAKADLDQTKLELSFTDIRSPLDGYIGASKVDIGGLVGSQGQSLLNVVVQTDPMFVNFNMTALDYLSSQRRLNSSSDSIPVKDVVSITLPDNTTYEYKGDLNFTAPEVDPKTGTYAVRGVVANPSNILLPGQPTTVKLLRDIQFNTVVIPNKAMEIAEGGAFVYVVKSDSTVERRFIETGVQFQNSTTIKRGLFPNETIVVEGIQKLTPGQRVKALNEQQYQELIYNEEKQ